MEALKLLGEYLGAFNVAEAIQEEEEKRREEALLDEGAPLTGALEAPAAKTTLPDIESLCKVHMHHTTHASP